ncbi:hypothetical protein HDU96_009983 [Phlyctochytrium bullatum]|nr:hypothetical protein HDU96_009983 [Phlyctochytrium bullatum]
MSTQTETAPMVHVPTPLSKPPPPPDFWSTWSSSTAVAPGVVAAPPSALSRPAPPPPPPVMRRVPPPPPPAIVTACERRGMEVMTPGGTRRWMWDPELVEGAKEQKEEQKEEQGPKSAAATGLEAAQQFFSWMFQGISSSLATTSPASLETSSSSQDTLGQRQGRMDMLTAARETASMDNKHHRMDTLPSDTTTSSSSSSATNSPALQTLSSSLQASSPPPLLLVADTLDDDEDDEDIENGEGSPSEENVSPFLDHHHHHHHHHHQHPISPRPIVARPGLRLHIPTVIPASRQQHHQQRSQLLAPSRPTSPASGSAGVVVPRAPSPLLYLVHHHHHHHHQPQHPPPVQRVGSPLPLTPRHYYDDWGAEDSEDSEDDYDDHLNSLDNDDEDTITAPPHPTTMASSLLAPSPAPVSADTTTTTPLERTLAHLNPLALLTSFLTPPASPTTATAAPWATKEPPLPSRPGTPSHIPTTPRATTPQPLEPAKLLSLGGVLVGGVAPDAGLPPFVPSPAPLQAPPGGGLSARRVGSSGMLRVVTTNSRTIFSMEQGSDGDVDAEDDGPALRRVATPDPRIDEEGGGWRRRAYGSRFAEGKWARERMAKGGIDWDADAEGPRSAPPAMVGVAAFRFPPVEPDNEEEQSDEEAPEETDSTPVPPTVPASVGPRSTSLPQPPPQEATPPPQEATPPQQQPRRMSFMDFATPWAVMGGDAGVAVARSPSVGVTPKPTASASVPVGAFSWAAAWGTLGGAAVAATAAEPPATTAATPAPPAVSTSLPTATATFGFPVSPAGTSGANAVLDPIVATGESALAAITWGFKNITEAVVETAGAAGAAGGARRGSVAASVLSIDEEVEAEGMVEGVGLGVGVGEGEVFGRCFRSYHDI